MKNIFPLIQYFAKPISTILVKLPITPNHLTALSLISGVTGGICFINAKFEFQILGGLMLLTSYILDYCDGEIARYKNLTSKFGERFDTFSDWIVHAVFFTALGYGTYYETQNNVWLLIGFIGSIGATINYFIVTFFESQNNEAKKSKEVRTTLIETIIFIFREMFRADFCFIVLALALTKFLHILLPVAAIGAQVYWILAIISNQKKHTI